MNLLLVLSVWFWLLVTVVTAFVFWRRLHKELPEEYLLRLILLTMIGAVVAGRTVWWLSVMPDEGWRISWWWQIASHPGVEWVGVILGGVLIMMRRLEGKYNHILGEIGDAYIEAVIWGMMLASLAGVVWRGSYITLGRLILTGGVVGIWYWLRSRYRRFSWYSSGKVGFLWWAGIGLLSLAQLAGAWLGNGRLIEVVYNGLLLLISVWGMYTISGRNFGRDVRGARKRLTRVSESDKN